MEEKKVDVEREIINLRNFGETLMITPEAHVKLSHNEILKENCPTLSGTLAQTLSDPAQDRFSEDDGQFLKFHGIYQQDDRDKRKTGKYYMFMIRGRIAGGVLSPSQYLVYDDLATRYGNNTLRITTRQSFQFHGVVKSGLGPLMKKLNEELMTTIAACGDVNRNVMAPPTPATSELIQRVYEDAGRVSDALIPTTLAYHSIWVEGVQLNLEDQANKDFVDPLYGKTYLPRKFKTAFVIPPLNDIDVYTNCLGFVAIGEGNQLEGYNLLAGGGMGMSHGNSETFPRMADVIGFFPPEKVVDVAKAVLTVHRDFGDRTNRKHARLKYVLEEKGPDWFRQEVESRVGFKFEPARPFTFKQQGDLYGWHKQLDGRHFLTLFVEAGRIKDKDDYRLKSGLREVVTRFKTEVRLTASQNLLLTNITADQVQPITELLAEYGVSVENEASVLRRASMACPALPTCGLALAESERYLPDLLMRFEKMLTEIGLDGEEIVIRMTGCPNGCARPFMAELGFVGRAPGKYQLYAGGNQSSTRLARLVQENMKEAEILNDLRPVLTRFRDERQAGERFGDWAARVWWNDSPVAQKAAAAATPAPSNAN